ncbi:DUF29 domain-containing protein [Leptolyngbya sp. FACHB-1515]|nr:DUF29 domain-containing protein [Microcoleus sp. FACHB-1515]
MEEALGKAYRKAVELAVSETDLLSSQSPEFPYQLAEI